MSFTDTQFDILGATHTSATSYLEVGVQEGRSLEHVIRTHHNLSEVYLVDTWGSISGGSGRGDHHHIAELLTRYLHITPIYGNGDSKEILPKLLGVLGERVIDIVHIDGGHDYDTALSDMMYGYKMAREVMVVHDISFSAVWEAFNVFVNENHRAIYDVKCYFGGHGTAVVTTI